MTSCCSLPVDDNSHLIEFSEIDNSVPARAENTCPNCGEPGKAVDESTLKSILLSSLRNLGKAQYFFCRTTTCPVVYFSSDGGQAFTTEHVRERVYQKEPDVEGVFVCYCFRHTVGEVRTSSPERRLAILHDINAGIKAEQCACDWRNPQGSCCLGNVRKVIKQAEKLVVATV
jgi:hypothetical protein